MAHNCLKWTSFLDRCLLIECQAVEVRYRVYAGSEITITSCNDLLNTIIVGVYSHWGVNYNSGDEQIPGERIATKLALKLQVKLLNISQEDHNFYTQLHNFISSSPVQQAHYALWLSNYLVQVYFHGIIL